MRETGVRSDRHLFIAAAWCHEKLSFVLLINVSGLTELFSCSKCESHPVTHVRCRFVLFRTIDIICTVHYHYLTELTTTAPNGGLQSFKMQ